MEANKAARQAVEADMDERCSRDVTRRMESVVVATDEEVVAASRLLNNDALTPNPNPDPNPKPNPNPNPNSNPNPNPNHNLRLLNGAMGVALRDIDPATRSFFKLFNKMVNR